MSTTCPGCTKAIKVEDVVVKSYTPVNNLQTCGMIKITKRGRVAARRIQCGDGIICDGAMEGTIETDGDVRLGPKATWRGKSLRSRSLAIADGAKLLGAISVKQGSGVRSQGSGEKKGSGVRGRGSGVRGRGSGKKKKGVRG